MNKYIAFSYNIISYIVGCLSIACFILFLFGFYFYGLSDRPNKLGNWAWVINLGLLVIFGLQHSIMARHKIKRRLSLSLAVERGTYVLISGLTLLFLLFIWQPMPGYIWKYSDGSYMSFILNSVCGIGCAIFIISTFMISHTELFGLRQAWLQLKNKQHTEFPFCKRGFYSLVRHPMMTGVLIAVWATPNMTISHLAFALGITVYVLIGIYFEEKETLRVLGIEYENYIKNTPKLFPHMSKKNHS